MRGRALAVAAVAVALLMQGCTNAPHATPPPTSTSAPAPNSAGEDGPTVLTINDARRAVPGADFELVGRVPGRTRDGMFITTPAVTADGDLVATVFRRRPAGTVDAGIRLIDPRTGDWEVLVPPGASSAGVQRVAVSDRWLVWQTASRADLMQEHWTLWAADRTTGEVRRLADAPRTRSGQRPRAPLSLPPTIGADGRVYVASVRQVGKDRYRPFVESVSLDRPGRLRTETRGVGPVATGGRLVWAGPGTGPPTILERPISGDGPHVLFDAAGTGCTAGAGLGAAGPITAWLLRCGHSAPCGSPTVTTPSPRWQCPEPPATWW